MPDGHTDHPTQPPANRPANRLAASTSPYLLQHAHNPVDWYPWGEEAFAEARRRDVPIFLSIGYSTCYWCHVMERESFEDEATAKLMNERLVCIKLDREERPDLDDIYMAATVAMTGQGGWPMSVFLEPDTLRPFFCGTYYPKEPMHGRPTFSRVVEAMADAYRTQRDDVRTQAARLAASVQDQLATPASPVAIGVEVVEEALSRVLGMFDPVHGGFGSTPKFPQAVFIEFLLDVRDIVDDDTRTAIDRCVRTTLDAMAMGGIHDHIGGGFHRYSVDATWTVPHFEKMLYDQAQMMSVYARAATIYADAWYTQVSQRIEYFVGSRMTDPEGGYYSAMDAEVAGREGLNYLWTPDQVHASRPASEAALVIKTFGLDQPPNFRDPHHPSDAPAWVLRMHARPEAAAAAQGLTTEDYLDQLSHAVTHMEVERNARPSPTTDTKVLACWNGCMITALAASGAPSRSHDPHGAAHELPRVLARLTRADGGLYRTTRAADRGETPHTAAFLEDYAALALACLAVGRASPHPAEQWSSRARALIHAALDTLTARSGDSLRIFDAPASPDLFIRACSTHDGAMPCGFSLFLHALLDLAEVSPPDEAARLRGTCADLLRTMSARIAENPVGTINSVRALLRLIRTAPSLAAPLGHGAAPTPVNAIVSSATAVEVLATDERIVLAEGVPAQLTIRVRIKPGYHLIAADPGTNAPPTLVPFRVRTANGAGVEAYADYPAGTPIPAAPDVLVYAGDFDLTIALERSGDWSGTPLLVVTCQACSDTECLAPAKLELDIALDRA